MKQNTHFNIQSFDIVDSIDERLCSALLLGRRSREWSIGDPRGLRRLRLSIAQLERLTALTPDRPDISELLAEFRCELAARLRSMGEFAEAEQQAQLANEAGVWSLDGSVAVGHLYNQYRWGQCHLENALSGMGENPLGDFRAAVDRFQALCDRFPQVSRYRELLAYSEFGLARALSEAGEVRGIGRWRRLAARHEAEARHLAQLRTHDVGSDHSVDIRSLDQVVSLAVHQRQRARRHGTQWVLEISRFLQILVWGLLPFLAGLFDARLFAAALPIGMLYLLLISIDAHRLTRRVAKGMLVSSFLQAYFVGDLHDALVLCTVSTLLSMGVAFLCFFARSRVFLSGLMLAKVGGIACRTDEIAQQWALWIARHAPVWLEVLLCEPSAEGDVGRVRWPLYWVAGCIALSYELVKFTQFLSIWVARELSVPPRPPNPVPRESRRNTSASWAVFLRRPLHLARGDDVPLCLSTT